MKTFNSFGIIALFIFTFGLYSCNDDDDETNPITPQTTIRMEGDGGIQSITFKSDNWRIAGVINKASDQRIFGETYDEDGKLVKENSLLELDNLGKLDAPWMDKGFNISRKTTNSLQIELYENATGEEFNFSIIIESEGKTREVVLVNQKVSEGYTFEAIEYYLTEDDKDKLYFKENMRYRLDMNEAQEVEISPFGGAGIISTSYFISDDSYAFVWFNENQPEVEVPIAINQGKIYLSNDKKIYGETTQSQYDIANGIKEKISVPAGKSQFHTELEWHNRQVSYKLTMKNKRTGDLKTVEGKWLEMAPTGKYTIIRDY